MTRKTKIIFINPPQSVREGDHVGLKFPLGFLYMAGTLEEDGFAVRIVDSPVYWEQRSPGDEPGLVKVGLPPGEILRQVEEFQPDIVGVSCAYTSLESDSFEIIDRIKERWPDKLLVVGGAHASANPAHVLRNPHINLVAIGEGEYIIREIARRVEAGVPWTDVKGTARMAAGRFQANPRQEYIEDLDALRPAWHLLDMERYFRHPDNAYATMRPRSVDIISSRGCPGRCVFCSIHTVWGRKWRARTPANVVDEIEMLCRRYGARQFRFQDDNLTLNKKRIEEICDEIVRRGLDIRWDTPNGVAIWTLDEEILRNMRRAGCYRVTFGVESACGDIQQYIGKIVPLEKLNRIIEFCHRIHLWVCATFIVGFPHETREQVEETARYITQAGINFPFVYAAQPWLGTRMYDDFASHGLLADVVNRASHASHTRYRTLHFSSEELNAVIAGIRRDFFRHKLRAYLNPRRFHHEFLSKIRSWEDLVYVVRMFRSALWS